MGDATKSNDLGGSLAGSDVIDAAPVYVFRPKPEKRFPCTVCGTPGATKRSGHLCWVCRRLKISAWRDSDAQEASAE